MTPDKLQEMYFYAWDTFYSNGGQQIKMGELFKKVIHKEIDDGTYHRYNPKQKRSIKTRQTKK